jgi:hypothetical protein
MRNASTFQCKLEYQDTTPSVKASRTRYVLRVKAVAKEWQIFAYPKSGMPLLPISMLEIERCPN